MAAKTHSITFSNSNLPFSIITPTNSNCLNYYRPRKKLSNFTARCSVNLPLKVTSPAGKSLSAVIQNEPGLFYDSVSVELKRLRHDKDSAFHRFALSRDSPEASLHRRIAKLKESECQIAVEDVLYMIISYKFSEIRVPLVPSLSKCLYNGRLEILPSKDWELESIHSEEILEMVREHLSIVLGWKAGSGVSVNWSTTEVHRHHLSQVYVTSLLFGYFLKSASLRFRLEHNLPPTFENVPCGNWTPPREFGSHSIKNVGFGQMVVDRPRNQDEQLRCYVTGLDMETRNLCAKLKSQEGAELMEKHCSALFGNGGEALTENKNEVILTSLSSMKRLSLEAIAFGCFLWDAEQFVNGIYKLKDN